MWPTEKISKNCCSLFSMMILLPQNRAQMFKSVLPFSVAAGLLQTTDYFMVSMDYICKELG